MSKENNKNTHNKEERLKITKIHKWLKNFTGTEYTGLEKFAIGFSSFFMACMIGMISYGVVEGIKYKKNQYDENGIPKKIVAFSNGYETKFDKCYDYQVIDNEAIKKYKSKYIYFLVNKETDEIDEFVIFDGKEFSNNTILKHIYDFDTEDLLTFQKACPDLFDEEYMNQAYYNYLVKENDWFTLKDSLALFGETCKDYYTKEEIKNIEEKFIEAYKMVKEDKKRSI